MSHKGFSTKAIHAGQEPDELTGAVNVPVYLTSTYAQEEVGRNKGWEYARVTNPTRSALEKSLAALEGGTSSHVFGSGMAAIAALCTMMKAGDHVVCSQDIYGGTQRLFDKVLVNYGLEFSYVDASDPKNIEVAITPKTKLVHIESPTNPMMSIVDIAAVAAVCKRAGVELSVDNTFLSPYLQSPIELGADIVMHSTTKFLNGHSDGLGGVLIGTKPEHAERFGFVQKCMGGILGAFDCYLILRGVKTLALRMRQHDANGAAVADLLSRHPKVERVYYPGLPSHTGYEIAKRQQRGFGSMMSFDLGSRERVNRFVKALRIGLLAESLGGVETLISHSATMTHAGLTQEQRDALGITDGLVRVSVGCEDVEDLLADFQGALDAC